MVIVAQAAFAVACFCVLSDIYECSGDLRMAPSPLDKQPAGYKSPHDWLVRLGMDLALLCVTYVEPKLAPTDAIWLFSVQTYL